MNDLHIELMLSPQPFRLDEQVLSIIELLSCRQRMRPERAGLLDLVARQDCSDSRQNRVSSTPI